jgi:hypothetical protein
MAVIAQRIYLNWAGIDAGAESPHAPIPYPVRWVVLPLLTGKHWRIASPTAL